ncbi:MAG: hypothetical protein AAGH70_10365 [Pseudomonadota bacterium]
MRHLIAALCLIPTIAVAEGVEIELNAVEGRDAACRMVFTARSEAGVDGYVLETAIFDSGGGVALLTLFDFMELPAGSLRVRQFDIPEQSCDGLGTLLFNGVDACSGPGCEGGLKASSRVEGMEVLQ